MSREIVEGIKLNYLVVVAHPDDEVLGAGATILKLQKEGHTVAVATMSNHAAARVNISVTLSDDQKRAFEILGVKKSYSANFPNIKMNTVPHLELVQFIESWKHGHEAFFKIFHDSLDFAFLLRSPYPAKSYVKSDMVREGCELGNQHPLQRVSTLRGKTTIHDLGHVVKEHFLGASTVIREGVFDASDQGHRGHLGYEFHIPHS